MLGGLFEVNQPPYTTFLARLSRDGVWDSGFTALGGPDDNVETITTQADGKILIGGYFHQVNGVERHYVARMNVDGSLDETFNSGSGRSDAVFSISLQSDDKILIADEFN